MLKKQDQHYDKSTIATFEDRQTKALFSSSLKVYTISHRIFGHMHEVLNIDKKITNCTDCDYFTRWIF